MDRDPVGVRDQDGGGRKGSRLGVQLQGQPLRWVKSSASSWQPPGVFDHLGTGLRNLPVGAVSGLSAATGVQLVGEKGMMM